MTLQLKTTLPMPGPDQRAGLPGRTLASWPDAHAGRRGTPLHAPALTSRAAAASRAVPVAAATTPWAGEPGTATAAQAAAATAAAVPAIVAATLGTNTAPPAASPAGSESNGSAAAAPASMPIQALADRVFSILERRLVVERERRGIRS